MHDLIIRHEGNCEEPFSEETMNLAIQIKSISPKAYAVLTRGLPFPSSGQVDSVYKKMIETVPDEFIDISRVNDLVDTWKNKHNISKSINISACLSVDALYFKPDAKITVDNYIDGSAFTDELKGMLPDNSYKYFTENASEVP